MKVMVTGACGFIGSHVVHKLLDRGDSVIAVDTCNWYAGIERKHRAKESFNGLEVYPYDIRNPSAAALVDVSGVEAIVHLAALPSVRQSIGKDKDYLSNNLDGTRNLMQAAIDSSANCKFILASTSSVYGHSEAPFTEDMACDRPLAPYPASKRMAEMLGHSYHNLYGLSFTALRFFSVYGPNGRPDMMPYMTMENIAKQQPITLFNGGEMWRDWTYVGDIVDGIISAVDATLGYEIINLGRGQPVKMLDFVEAIEAEMGLWAQIETASAPLSEPERTQADISKARTLLGYEPSVSIADGVRQMCDWYKKCN